LKAGLQPGFCRVFPKYLLCAVDFSKKKWYNKTERSSCGMSGMPGTAGLSEWRVTA